MVSPTVLQRFRRAAQSRLLDSSPGGGRSEVNLRSQSAGWGQDRASDGDPGQTQLREAMQVPRDEAEPRPGRESAAQGQRDPGLSMWAWARWWEHCRHTASGLHAGTEGPGLIPTGAPGQGWGQAPGGAAQSSVGSLVPSGPENSFTGRCNNSVGNGQSR